MIILVRSDPQSTTVMEMPSHVRRVGEGRAGSSSNMIFGPTLKVLKEDFFATVKSQLCQWDIQKVL